MLKKAKEAIGTTSSRTRGIVAVAVIYLVVMITTVSLGAVDQLVDYIPTVNINVKDGLEDPKGYLVKQDTVAHVLDEVDIVLNEGDTVDKDPDYIVQADDSLTVFRLTTKTVVEESKIPYKTITKGSGTWGTKVTQEGKNGILKQTYSVSYKNDEEVSRKLVKEERVEPVDKIVSASGVSEGASFTGRLTVYGGDCAGCSGRAASGLNLSAKSGVNNSNSPYLTYRGKKYYCLAADRSIPFGTVIKISNHNLSTEGTIYGIVVDRGGAIKGNKIDIFKGSESSGSSYFSGGTSNNTKFEIVSVGSGRAYFWK